MARLSRTCCNRNCLLLVLVVIILLIWLLSSTSMTDSYEQWEPVVNIPYETDNKQAIEVESVKTALGQDECKDVFLKGWVFCTKLRKEEQQRAWWNLIKVEWIRARLLNIDVAFWIQSVYLFIWSYPSKLKLIYRSWRLLKCLIRVFWTSGMIRGICNSFNRWSS